ncbi:MAG: hypothetical protein TQ35_0007415 [Candidatus Aramenus sulfurataquae]|jgi:hypothetical protein|uniref:Uncharacterized protein n=2 Tax=Candidatus Aramenus sulfurataquae TaxID=1326980 RepID=A0A0F2LLE6_9CREN|nr:hypothetical protein [Candidatus Aramenus sulfurataquae]
MEKEFKGLKKLEISDKEVARLIRGEGQALIEFMLNTSDLVNVVKRGKVALLEDGNSWYLVVSIFLCS